MPDRINFANAPIGFAVRSALPGEYVPVQSTGIYSSEDGPAFLRMLDAVGDLLFAHIPGVFIPAVHQIVAVIDRSGSAVVHINSPAMVLGAQTRRSLTPGEVVTDNDIADILSLDFDSVTFPADAGILVLFSVRWRKTLFFDLAPLLPSRPSRSIDVSTLLAKAMSYSVFQDRLGLTEEQWTGLRTKQWFPFMGIPRELLRTMLIYVDRNGDVDDCVKDIVAAVKGSAERFRESVRTATAIEGHREVILKAMDHFMNGDYLSCSGLLYPRIEGLMRAHRARSTPSGSHEQSQLAKSVTTDLPRQRHDQSPLLPRRFETYLREIYFASFTPSHATGVSRHTVGHGVAPEADLRTAKAAVIAILITEQLLYFMSPVRPVGGGTPEG